ncbi:MAG: aminotransferase [Rhodospirillaceae bacterium]|nr:aminotransferase [Rhodospirillaceae bacterium]|tara:strand:+ start:11753 stop:12994 length:1242 start_codon:yes stop_codon:yes gene_type:complete
MSSSEIFDELNPPPRLMMGPGPVNVDPRVLNAMSMPLLGQFDPAFTEYMNEVMVLYRQVFQTKNRWTFLIDGTARAAIETFMVSTIEPGDKVLVPVFGRFGHLLTEIAERCGADVEIIEVEWGNVFDPQQIEDAVKRVRPKVVALCQGDTSTTVAQPLAAVGEICSRFDAFSYVDATASLVGMDLPVDKWKIDCVSVSLQKCLAGPPGIAPITFNDRVADLVNRRKHIEKGIRPEGFEAASGPMVASNYFDLGMLMDYWSEARLNHHTEATSMLYAARECARVVLKEGLQAGFDRHALASKAMVAGLEGLGLKVFGDKTNKMPNVTGVYIPDGVDGEAIRSEMLHDFGIEIGTSFGPLHGKIWRIGAMGYNCQKHNILTCLAALETILRQHSVSMPAGGGVDAALAEYRAAGQ